MPENDTSPDGAKERSTRERLLDAGLELFGTVGYEATTISALCRSARVSTRAFYRHATSRSHLFRTVFDRELRRIDEPVGKALAEAPLDWEVRVRAWTSTWLSTVFDDLRRYRILYREAVGVDGVIDDHRRQAFRHHCVMAGRQLHLCTPGAEVLPAERFDMAGAAVVGAAREIMDQHVDGVLGALSLEQVADAIVDVALAVARTVVLS